MKKLSFWLSILFIFLSHIFTLLSVVNAAHILLPVNFMDLFYILLDDSLFFPIFFIPLAIIFLILSVINQQKIKISPTQRLFQIIGIISLAYPAYIILRLQ